MSIKHCLLASIFSMCMFACAVTNKASSSPNIIYVIGDGMGFEYVAAYRYFKHSSDDAVIADKTLFDQWLVGSVSTTSVDRHAITDSAASGMALSSGIKTHNGVIGLDAEGKSHETLLERAKKVGFTTAMVVTSQINHATPASFAAHTISRNNYNEIADQYIDRRHNGKPFVDLLVGGGQKYFIREDRNIVNEFKAEGYEYAESLDDLYKLKQLPALALLAKVGMPHAIDDSEPARLSRMTEKSLQLLKAANKPFFLMIEASQIDWCGHANDIACAMAEMHDAEKTLAVIRGFIKNNPNTLVVMTADHSTGGLSIGANGQYQWRPDFVGKVQASVGKIVDKLQAEPKAWHQTWAALTNIPLKAKDKAMLATIIENSQNTGNKKNSKILRQHVQKIINARTLTGWTTGGHTGGDVPLIAYGKHKELFSGHIDNTEIAHKLFELIR